MKRYVAYMTKREFWFGREVGGQQSHRIIIAETAKAARARVMAEKGEGWSLQYVRLAESQEGEERYL